MYVYVFVLSVRRSDQGCIELKHVLVLTKATLPLNIRKDLSVQCLVIFGTGDTVNIASRMESNSEVLKIHCSEAAAKLVMVQDPSLCLSPRGAIPIKGKSKMNTFWVHESNSSKDAGIYIAPLLSIDLTDSK
jgi:hypothetical protein